MTAEQIAKQSEAAMRADGRAPDHLGCEVTLSDEQGTVIAEFCGMSRTVPGMLF